MKEGVWEREENGRKGKREEGRDGERKKICIEMLLCHSLPPSFLTAHIWACPPSEGDDYIFHCHPEEQKIPKPKRLTEWYRKMLDTGKSQEYNVICDYRVSGKLFSLLEVASQP